MATRRARFNIPEYVFDFEESYIVISLCRKLDSLVYDNSEIRCDEKSYHAIPTFKLDEYNKGKVYFYEMKKIPLTNTETYGISFLEQNYKEDIHSERYAYPQEGDVLTEEQIKDNIYRIVNEYIDVDVLCEIYKQEDVEHLYFPLKKGLVFKDDSDKVLSITADISLCEGITSNDILSSVFESILFFYNEQTPYNIVAVIWNYNCHAPSNLDSLTGCITLEEFQEIYENTDFSTSEGKSAQIAKIMADKWLSQER